MIPPKRGNIAQRPAATLDGKPESLPVGEDIVTSAIKLDAGGPYVRLRQCQDFTCLESVSALPSALYVERRNSRIAERR
jgi:hypothetical protein